MRVVFMGTPDIAAACLEKIIADGFDVVGVYTQPDRPKNRGMKLCFSAVKEVALKHDLPVAVEGLQARCDRRGSVRPYSAPKCFGHSYLWLYQYPCQCVACLPGLCPLSVGGAGRFEADRCYRYVSVPSDGRRRYYRCIHNRHRS